METKNLELYNRVKTVPKEAQKTITGGRLNGMTDINPMWRIKTLTEQFGVCGFGWKYEIGSMRIEEGAKDTKAAFVTIDLFVKINDQWSDPIPGTGGASFVALEKNGAYTSDECFKMALTDAISVACKSLGIGADIYFAKDATKYQSNGNGTAKLNIDVEKLLSQCNTKDEIRLLWDSLTKDEKVKYMDSFTAKGKAI